MLTWLTGSFWDIGDFNIHFLIVQIIVLIIMFFGAAILINILIACPAVVLILLKFA
jgi:hypothetical protein